MREQWLAAQAAGRRRRPVPLARSCELTSRPDGRFDVVIRGSNLSPGAAPPMIRIAGRFVRQVVAADGTSLRGVVDAGEPGDAVTIDLGPAGQTGTTVREVS